MDDVKTMVELQEEMAATAMGASGLTDVATGGLVYGLIKATARPLARLYRLAMSIWRGFFFRGDGADLDDQVAQLIAAGFEPRMGSSPAWGSTLRLERLNSVGELTVNAGAVFRSQTGVNYALAEPITFLAGEAIYPADGQAAAVVAATVPGAAGNTGASTIDQVVRAPGVVAVTNMTALTNGSDREPDQRLRARAFDFVAGLSGTQAAALRALALSTRTDAGVTVPFAYVYEPPERRAEAELVLDDGSGMPGFTRPAVTFSDTVPENGIWEIPFDWPAATTPVLNVNGVRVYSGFTVYPERGYLVPQPGLLSPGDSWDVGGHAVYTGIVAQIQRLIEASAGTPGPGHRAAGGRVIVRTATPVHVSIELLIVAATGYELADVVNRARTAVVAHLRSLGPRQPLLLFDLMAALHRVAGVRNARILSPTGDYYPSDPRTTVTTTEDRVTINV